jgi:Cys-rich protein (TIGR01571 family)
LISGAAQLLYELSSPLSTSTIANSKEQLYSSKDVPPAIEIPVGQWRDSVCDLFHYGYCHGSVWTSICCLPLATGQIISRLHLTICGKPGIALIRSRSLIFLSIVIAVVTFLVVRVFLFLLITLHDPNVMNESSIDWIEPSKTYYILCAIDDCLGLIGTALVIYQIYRVRLHVRTRYAIPGNAAGDLTCSMCCPTLVAAQLLRHTTDYEQYPSMCCLSATGIPLAAPSIVES